jgi:hypothetical protein
VLPMGEKWEKWLFGMGMVAAVLAAPFLCHVWI